MPTETKEIVGKPESRKSPKPNYDGILRRFARNKKGNFTIIAAGVLPVGLLGVLYGADSYYRTSRIEKFNDYVEQACYRALKPLRARILNDKKRSDVAQTIFAGSFPSEFKNLDTKVDVNWLTVNATATASFDPVLTLLGSEEVPVQASFSCEGIPPYPTDNEVVLQSTFTNEQGRSIVLPRSHRFEAGAPNIENCWGGYDPRKLGWDGSYGLSKVKKTVFEKERYINGDRSNDYDASKSVNLEIQFWGTPPKYYRSACFAKKRSNRILDDETPSEYGIEFDYYYNTGVWKNMELHPGHYELSLWYYGRPGWGDILKNKKLQKLTNATGVYMEGLRGEKPLKRTPALCMTGTPNQGWRKLTYNFMVPEYNVYRFSVQGEGLNDTYGGVFNGFQVKYLDDLNSDDNFPKEYEVGSSDFSNYNDCTEWVFDTTLKSVMAGKDNESDG